MFGLSYTGSPAQSRQGGICGVNTHALARQNFLTECSITVVRMHGVHVDWVQFPALRPIKFRRVKGACSLGSIPSGPKL